MDPYMNPKMDPARLILGEPCKKMVLQGPLKVHIGKSFYIDLLTFTAWFEVNPTFSLRDIAFLILIGKITHPPLLGLNWEDFKLNLEAGSFF